MTERIVEYLRDLAATVGGIDISYCLAERYEKSSDEPTTMPYIYQEGGNPVPVEVDSGSVSYFRLVSPIAFAEVQGMRAVKDLQGTYPIRFVAMVRRDDNNPLTYSQDVANIFEGRKKDLKSILQAKNAKITVNSISTDTPNIWKEEFTVPVSEPNYTRSMVMIDLTVEVTATRECWQSCDSYPDILQGFPWCSETEATLDRLTQDQRDCIENELCGVCADGEVSINGDSVGTVASGGSLDVDVLQGGSPVGSWNGSEWIVPVVPCDDADYTNSDGSYSGSVVSGGTLNIPDIDFTDSDGTTTSVPSVQNLVCTPAASIPTLTIGVFSDVGLLNPITEADYLDTIYINITTSITTPTEYRFFISGRDEYSTTQGTATLAYTVNGLADLTIYAEAIDGTSVAASKPSKTITVVNTVADAFIAAHETETGVSMDSYQQGIIETAYEVANGIGSTNGTDLLALLTGTGAVLFPYVPTSDSVASADAYKIDFLDPTNFCTFVGFVSGDFLPSGLIGGTGKYARLGAAPSDFGQNDISFSAVPCGGVNVGAVYAMGVQDASTNSCAIQKNFNNTTLTGRYWSNDNAEVRLGTGGAFIDNVITNNRRASYSLEVYEDGAIFQDGKTSAIMETVTPSTKEFYAHALNNNGSAASYDSDPYGGFHISYGLNTKVAEDVGFLLKYIKDNIITGGR